MDRSFRHIAGVRRSAIVRHGPIGRLPSRELLDGRNACEPGPIVTDPERTPPLAAPRQAESAHGHDDGPSGRHGRCGRRPHRPAA